jgi:hypothetical protein
MYESVDDLSANRRLMLIPMTTHEHTIEEAAE